jgi:hypothetical protein
MIKLLNIYRTPSRETCAARPAGGLVHATIARGSIGWEGQGPLARTQEREGKWLDGAAFRPRRRVRNDFSTILDYSASMGTRPDDSKKTAVRALRRRQTLLAAWLDVLNQLDGRGRQRPEIPARPAIPSSRQPRSARSRRRLAAYSQEGHVAALTARLRRTAPL